MKPWIQTYLGKYFDLLDPNPSSIDIRDIAHALAQVNRYTGHAFRPYSVAEHSVRVAKHAGLWDGVTFGDRARARYGLLHDASEAYLGDVSRPLKSLLSEYRKLEDQIMVKILLKFGVELDDRIEEAVKRSDTILLVTEKRDMLGPPPADWEIDVEPLVEFIEPRSWRSAETDFLTAFGVLFPEHKP